MSFKFNLQKDEPFDLTKLDPEIPPVNFYCGVNWTPAESGAKIDLDLALIGLDGTGKMAAGQENFVYFGNRREGLGEYLELSKDDRTGDMSEDTETGDDEYCYIRTPKTPAGVVKIAMFITYYKSGGKTLADVSQAGFRICPLKDDGKPDFSKAASAIVTDIASEGMKVAELVKTDKGWDIVMLAESSSNIEGIAKSYGVPV